MFTKQHGGGFGAGEFGSSPIGTGYELSVISAFPISRNSIDVTFAGIPYAQDAAFAFSALLPSNWTLSVREPYGAKARLVQYIEKISDSIMRVYFDGELDSYATYRVIVSSIVVDDYGIPINPFSAFSDFSALGVINKAAQTPIGQEQRTDLANPQFERDAQQLPVHLGTYQIGVNHDFAYEAGRAYLRKRVIRRAITSAGKGGFFHLPGYGFSEPLKGNLTLSTLTRIQSRAQVQILEEPDVVDVKVSVRVLEGTTSTVVIRMHVTDKYGNVDTIETEADLAA